MKTINATVYVRPDKVNAFLAMGQTLTMATRKEKGNIRFDFYRSSNCVSSFVFVEIYRDQEAIIAHRDSHHFQNFLKDYQQIQNAPMDVMIFEGLGSAD